MRKQTHWLHSDSLLRWKTLSQFRSDVSQASIHSPQQSIRQENGSQEMEIDPAHASTEQALLFKQTQDVIVVCNFNLRQRFQKPEHFVPVADRATGKLANYKWVAKNAAFFQQTAKFAITAAQVLNPHGCVDKRHRLPARRRRIFFKPFSVPPNFASRRALSRATSASNPSRTREVFSAIPERRAAFLSNSSSMLSVVLICMILHE
jgi:hypothetical protein